MRRLERRVPAGEAGRRLDAVLAEWLPQALGRPLSKSRLRQLVMAGAVRVDGRPLRRPGAELRAGSRLEAHVRLDLLPEPAGAAEPPRITEAHVLYEDAALIAVDKPAGLPMHATADPARPDLYSLVLRFLRARPRARAAPDATYLGLHQRLDRDTSGVVLFTLDPAANAPLADAFARHAVVKTYEALTHAGRRRPPASWRATSALAPLGSGRGRRMQPVAAGGQDALTEFRLLEALPGGCLIEAVPRSGRKHQIRAHLAAAGWPLLGDERYASGWRAPLPVPRAMLHARSLALSHPLTRAPLRLESPRPDDFRRLLEALRRARA